MKTCGSCGREMPLTFFHRDGSRYRANCKECRKIKRTSKYGLTSEEYLTLHEAQNGKCGICGSEHKLVVDHCHDTGAVRGLLCSTCNRAIGLLNDCPHTLENAQRWVDPFTINDAERALQQSRS